MRSLLLSIQLLLLHACIRPEATINYSHINGILIADTSAIPRDKLDYYVRSPEFPIYYVGTQKDTIKIGHRYYGKWHLINDSIYRKKGGQIAPQNLLIQVDTSCNTTVSYVYYNEMDEQVNDSTRFYYAWLITLANISDSILFMGTSRGLTYMHREAKDKKGRWIKIGKNLRESGVCLSGSPDLSLQPGQIIIGKVLRYKGDRETDFRLGFGWGKQIVYSNIFRDSIDHRTFLSE